MKLLLVGSPWHAVTAAGFVRAHGLADVQFAIEYFGSNSLRSIRSTLDAAGFSGHVVAEFDWADIALEPLVRQRRAAAPWHIVANLGRWKRWVGGRGVDELAVFNVNSPVFRALLRGVGDGVPVTKLEDGVVDYLPFKYTGQRWLFVEGTKALLTRAFGVADVYCWGWESVMQRVTTQYSIFPRLVQRAGTGHLRGYDDLVAPIRDVLRSIGAAANLSIPCGAEEGGGSRVLIIGQSLAEDRSMPLSAEVDLYAEVARRFVSEGYHVVLKPHPRSSRQKLSSLQSVLARIDGADIIDTSIPVEALLVTARFSGVVGLWSNPVIYGRKLLGVESYSLMYELRRRGALSPLLDSIHRQLADTFPSDYVDTLGGSSSMFKSSLLPGQS